MVTETTIPDKPSFESSYSENRAYSQIIDTIRFEFTRNFRKTLTILSLFLGVFAIVFIYNFYTFRFDFLTLKVPNNILPDVPGDYINGSYLMVIELMILLLAILYGASTLVEDFENQTGNLVFPNTTKFRLLTARFISGFILGSLSLLLYYFLIALDVAYEYGLYHVPKELLYSAFWAILYYFMLLALTFLFSSFSKSTSFVVIFLVLFVLIVFNIVRVFIAFAGYTGEPFFIITYFGDIITQILTYPASRKSIEHLGFRSVVSGGGSGNGTHAVTRTYTRWLTPSPAEALFFMIFYGVIFLVASYFVYERRQVQ